MTMIGNKESVKSNLSLYELGRHVRKPTLLNQERKEYFSVKSRKRQSTIYVNPACPGIFPPLFPVQPPR